ncbi:MAG: hypothetical protein LBO71_07895 [Prevotellaceae bacterium]|nr:hypothetical protein [Prevotellaceae bacterium]
MKSRFFFLLLLCLPTFTLGQPESAKSSNFAVSGELSISGPFLGANVEYLFYKNRWSAQASFGLVGASAGVSYHLKPRINSSFVSLQYSFFGGDDKYNLLGAMYVYRYKRWFQAGAGLGTLLSDNGEQKRGTLIPMLNGGIYFPLSNQASSTPPTLPPNADKPEERKRPQQAIYAEIGGRGMLFSVSYDRRLFVGDGRFGASIGVGGIAMFGAAAIFLPAYAYYLVGSGSSYLEVGAGITGAPLPFSSASFGTATIGYRYQPAKGLLFRIGLTPMYSANYFQPWWGISVGTAF